ncbi:MAG TPA: RHS repeat-associated core domain-containing protein [Phycisphaerae bacterium]|nr:RHS repeat-associated core domain-containing protein [Phycisphaerae bacterium]
MDLGDWSVWLESFGWSFAGDCGVFDLDADLDVDLYDHAGFQVCFSGEGGTPPPSCRLPTSFYHDADADLDIDLGDWANLQNCFDPSGAQAPPDCLAVHDFDAAGLADGDLDLDDYARFFECWGGPGILADRLCAPPVRGLAPTALTGADVRGLAPTALMGDSPGAEWNGVTNNLPPSGTFTLHGRPVDVLSDGHVLFHFRARYYDPVLGRWLQRDPLPYNDGVNLYEPFRGNALSHLDPHGEGVLTWMFNGDYSQSDWEFLRGFGAGLADSTYGSTCRAVGRLQERSTERYLLLIQAQEAGDPLLQTDADVFLGGLLLAAGDIIPSGKLAEAATGISTGLNEAPGSALTCGTRVVRGVAGGAETGLFALFSTTAMQSGAASQLEARFFVATGGRMRLGLLTRGQLVRLLESEAAAGRLTGRAAQETMVLVFETGVEEFALQTPLAAQVAGMEAFAVGRTETLPRLLGISGAAGERAAAELLAGQGEILVNTQVRQGAVLQGFDLLSARQTSQGVDVFLNEIRNRTGLQAPGTFSALGLNRAATFQRNLRRAGTAVETQVSDRAVRDAILDALKTGGFSVRIIGRPGIRVTPSTSVLLQDVTGTANPVLILDQLP